MSLLEDFLDLLERYGGALLVIATFLLVISNYQLIQTQKELSSPHLLIRQDEQPKIIENFYLVSDSGWDVYTRICFRNDGRTSTGAITIKDSIRKSWNSTETGLSFDIGGENVKPDIDNVASGEGKCTLVGISHQWTNRGDPGKVELVPTGLYEIPLNITCLFCDEFIQKTKIVICVKPTDKC